MKTKKVLPKNMPEKITATTNENVVISKKEIGKLGYFGNEDMMKVVEKINELVDRLNQCH